MILACACTAGGAGLWDFATTWSEAYCEESSYSPMSGFHDYVTIDLVRRLPTTSVACCFALLHCLSDCLLASRPLKNSQMFIDIPPVQSAALEIMCSTWHGQNEHISSVLSEILIVPFVLCFGLKPWSMRFWEALTCIKRTSGSRVTAPSFQQPFTCDLFMSYLADRRTDCSHPFCAGTPSFTPFFGLPELAKRPRIGCASPSSAWYDQDEHVSSVLGEILVAPFVLCPF
ncbi:GPI-anchored small secreted protein [Laccaria bicolor S238N-H82]|uniref:GPI-anchored small secreted protein n=1 Tax=Laccaria bicolor (strain S238N-H82 / ATCC MYA-4686) TaxID=486041 RepID=B0DU09_LACBS|nr:GPI-anchored small secreted protein [Laccaria bicolor S238N-H82]EDR01944.1 GPI-anchored small secreted protein [Laccaria bicolor S238N-H82]|eukprot:XP_001887335.1 GPI-anchored small secreted protein [Laccaria bicolor S238N-H82]